VMQRTLAVDPADRYATMSDLRDALLAIRVVTEFRPTPTTGAIGQWQAAVASGAAIVEVVAAPRATFVARLRIDHGSGPRTVEARPRRSTEAQAMRDARTLLRAVVEGTLP
jgi:hypothetical protein